MWLDPNEHHINTFNDIDQYEWATWKLYAMWSQSYLFPIGPT